MTKKIKPNTNYQYDIQGNEIPIIPDNDEQVNPFDESLVILKVQIDYINKIKMLKLDPKVTSDTHDELINNLIKVVKLLKEIKPEIIGINI